MNATIYTAAGKKSEKKAKLNSSVFEVEIKSHDLVANAYNAYLANGRTNNAVTKTRGLVRGGGKKPWRQKGTGRARFGSTRNPIWRTGGIVFGPTGNENYKINQNRKAAKLAIKQALSLAAQSKKIIIIEDIKLKDHKTSGLAKLLTTLGIKGNALLVNSEISKELGLASKNINNVILVRPKGVNVYNILNADHIVLSSDSVKEIEEWLGDK